MQMRAEILAEMHEWVRNDRNQSFQRDRRIEAITGLLRRSPLADKDKALVGSHLGILSNWYLILGTVRVADGHTAGWTDLSHGMWIDYCHVRLLVEQWEKDSRKTKQPRMDLLRPSLCLAMAMAFDRRDIADWLGNRLADSVHDGAFGKWGVLRLPLLVLKLYQRYAGQDLKAGPMGGDGSTPYVQIFAKWDHDEAFAQAIQAICDFHVQQSEDRGDEFIGEFSRYPFNIIPFEVFAIKNVRRREGLSTASIAHPLLFPPFDDVPTDVPDAADELLEKVKQLS